MPTVEVEEQHEGTVRDDEPAVKEGCKATDLNALYAEVSSRTWKVLLMNPNDKDFVEGAVEAGLVNADWAGNHDTLYAHCASMYGSPFGRCN
jgi:hypothetical protein